MLNLRSAWVSWASVVSRLASGGTTTGSTASEVCGVGVGRLPAADYNVIGVRPSSASSASSGNATSFSSLAPFTLASGSRPAPTERLVRPGSGAADLNPVRGATFIVTDGTTRDFLFFRL